LRQICIEALNLFGLRAIPGDDDGFGCKPPQCAVESRFADPEGQRVGADALQELLERRRGHLGEGRWVLRRCPRVHAGGAQEAEEYRGKTASVA
jgi:hypothetical protein